MWDGLCGEKLVKNFTFGQDYSRDGLSVQNIQVAFLTINWCFLVWFVRGLDLGLALVARLGVDCSFVASGFAGCVSAIEAVVRGWDFELTIVFEFLFYEPEVFAAGFAS